MGSPEAVHPLSFNRRANGLRLRVLHWPGDPGRPAFLLLHGLASNARIWELAGGRLAAAGHRVFAPDLRGHGQSDAPEDGYDFATVTRDLADLARVLGLEDVVVAGHSWGGQVALDYAAQHDPAALAMIDGGFTQLNDSPGATWEKVERALAPPRLAGTPLPVLLERLESLHPDWPEDSPWREIVLANFEVRADGTVAPHLTYENHMKVVRAMWEFPTYDRFDRVRCPSLIVAARREDPQTRNEDAFLRAKARGEDQARARLVDGRFLWLDDTDHDIPLHRPLELAELLLDLARRGKHR
jgi:pimeloyl-ACP methyl ester carboxylesterase